MNDNVEGGLLQSPKQAYSIIQQEFDWENADYMPTPEGMPAIPTPWTGQGSIAGTYDLDIINDRKNRKDGVYYIILFQQTQKYSSKIHSLSFITNTEGLCASFITLLIALSKLLLM